MLCGEDPILLLWGNNAIGRSIRNGAGAAPFLFMRAFAIGLFVLVLVLLLSLAVGFMLLLNTDVWWHVHCGVQLFKLLVVAGFLGHVVLVSLGQHVVEEVEALLARLAGVVGCLPMARAPLATEGGMAGGRHCFLIVKGDALG